jgi:glycosyltransferase involved in cell wall biosynthesis
VAGLREESIETHHLCVPGRSYLNERRAIAAICRRTSPTVVHTHGYRADVVDGLAVRQSTPIVSTIHGYTGGDAKNRFYEWVQRRSLRRFDAVVAVSTKLGRELNEVVRPERLHVIPNAIATPSDPLDRPAARVALGLPAESRVVGWVGRMSREKGADVLLDAFAASKLSEDVHLALLGDGPELESLRDQAKRLEIESRIRWLGRTKDACRYFAAFDVLVLSSRTEGTPMVVLEAMSAGVPIVATRVGGVPDVLVDGTAFLVEPDAPIALAATLRDVLENRDAAWAVARAARDRAERRYGVRNWVEAYESVYGAARAEAARRRR